EGALDVGREILSGRGGKFARDRPLEISDRDTQDLFEAIHDFAGGLLENPVNFRVDVLQLVLKLAKIFLFPGPHAPPLDGLDFAADPDRKSTRLNSSHVR